MPQFYVKATSEMQMELQSHLQRLVSGSVFDYSTTETVFQVLQQAFTTCTQPQASVTLFQTAINQILSMPSPPSAQLMEQCKRHYMYICYITLTLS